MKYTKCQKCPCFRDYYTSFNCTLRFKILCFKGIPVSKNCKLKSITYAYTSKRKALEYTPKKVEIKREV